MKILIDNFIFDLQYAGGISKVWVNLLNGFRRSENCDLTMIESKTITNLFRRDLNVRGITIINEKNGIVNYRKFKRISNINSDIYHSSYFRPLKKKGTTKVIVTIHDFIYEKYSHGLPKLIHLYFKNRALKQADGVICVSSHTREDFFNYYPNFPKTAVYVVHNGVDNLFSPLVATEPLTIKEHSLKSGSFLLYVGNRGYAKNFDFVWRLLKSDHFKATKLKLVCVGGGSVSKSEQKRMDELEVSNRILFFEGITPSQLNKLYNRAYLLLFPSIYEGFGIPVVEAMRAGCPIWSTNSSSVKELLGSDYPVSFSPHNWEEALEVFVRLSSQDLRERARQAGLVRSRNFSWENCAQETLDVYRKCLNHE